MIRHGWVGERTLFGQRMDPTGYLLPTVEFVCKLFGAAAFVVGSAAAIRRRFFREVHTSLFPFIAFPLSVCGLVLLYFCASEVFILRYGGIGFSSPTFVVAHVNLVIAASTQLFWYPPSRRSELVLILVGALNSLRLLS